jgi:protein gp37
MEGILNFFLSFMEKAQFSPVSMTLLLFLLACITAIVKMWTKLEKVEDQNVEMLTKRSSALEKLADAIEDNSTATRNLHNAITVHNTEVLTILRLSQIKR